MPRAAGLLLHPTSLPGRFGIGDLGPEAVRFLDWGRSAGQTLWQMLPLGPVGSHGSPYGGISSFAGNPLLISPDRLVEEGFLPEPALRTAPGLPRDRVDFAAVDDWKESLLHASWAYFQGSGSSSLRSELEQFRLAPEQSAWLPDWAVYVALRSRLRRPWTDWDRSLSRREPEALETARRELAPEIAYAEYAQFLFWRQWRRVRAEAAARGIQVVGDVPIYVAYDSADVWAHAELFDLAPDGRPVRVAGVPPDYFSRTGQLWGYPLYRWDRMEQDGYAWWIERIRASLRIADIVRIDHFRGFAAYWAVPASEETAVHGEWLPGPGTRLFHRLREALGSIDVIAEDLGSITPDVRLLLEELQLPGMRVLQFAFSEPDSDHLPHNHVPRCVAYTGTHDNDTARGWFSALSEEEKRRVRDYLGSVGKRIEWDLIRAVYTSVATRAIVPAQDVFGLASDARMNTPGLATGNWTWRSRAEQFTEERAARLRRLAELAGRVRS